MLRYLQYVFFGEIKVDIDIHLLKLLKFCSVVFIG